MFCSKAVYIPHLRTIVAGTGLGGFANDWANEINNRMVVKGIRNLNHHTPDRLRDRWSQVSRMSDFQEGWTTTVYQFGIDEEREEVCAFAYRSTNDFESEELGYGIFAKPPCAFPDTNNFVEAVHAMMIEQRRAEDQKPDGHRVYIGGECVILHLTKDECSVIKAFQFDDYEQQLRDMFDAFD